MDKKNRFGSFDDLGWESSLERKYMVPEDFEAYCESHKTDLSSLSFEELTELFKNEYYDWRSADNDLRDAHMIYFEYLSSEEFDRKDQAEKYGRYRVERIYREIMRRKPRFIIASNNPAKRAELEQILGDLGIVITTAEELGIEAPDPVEDGETFAENALIKAKAFVEASGLPAIADDSGLCVDALGGRPGVHSARYGGDHDSASAIEKLLGELEGVPDDKRSARFECHVVCLYPDGRQLDAHGTCEGYIAKESIGNFGFGFDPVFCAPDGRSFGIISRAEKAEISHRGKALRQLRGLLEENL